MRVLRLSSFLGGALALSMLSSPASAAPAEWTCDALLAEDDVCDCGCGVPDPACSDDGLLQCEVEHCDVDHAFPSPFDPAQCTTLEALLSDLFNFDFSSIDIPEEHLCPSDFIGGQDGCDCGCGALDPDCVDATVAACEFDTCADFGLVLDANDPTQCLFPDDFGLFDLLGLSDDLCEDSDDDDSGDDSGSEPDADSGDDDTDVDAGPGPGNDDETGDNGEGEDADAGPAIEDPDTDVSDAGEMAPEDAGSGDNGGFLYAPGADDDATDAPGDVGPLNESLGCAGTGADVSLLSLVLLWGVVFTRRRRRESLA